MGRLFRSLKVADVVRETADCKSFILEVPAGHERDYAYRPGQFLTFRVELDGIRYLRSYSMSSAPSLDEPLRVTVKRVPGGVVSNWMNDALRPGDEIEAGIPSGSFVLREAGADVVAFAGGSGITPVLSIVKTALLSPDRRVRLLYANRDQASVIFREELDRLQQHYGDRLSVRHHLDVEAGLFGAETVRDLLGAAGDAEFYLCGPEPFMRCVRDHLLSDGVEAARIHLERFTPEEATPVEAAGGEPVKAVIRLGRREETADVRPGSTLLQVARSIGLRPPSSCETGSCATCMARVVEGSAVMRNNEALTPEEVAEGWVLTCQAVPVGPSVRVVYE